MNKTLAEPACGGSKGTFRPGESRGLGDRKASIDPEIAGDSSC
jgi:hypothetical protein